METNAQLILEYRRRYWTLVQPNGVAVLTFPSLAKAVAFAPEAGIKFTRSDQA